MQMRKAEHLWGVFLNMKENHYDHKIRSMRVWSDSQGLLGI